MRKNCEKILRIFNIWGSTANEVGNASEVGDAEETSTQRKEIGFVLNLSLVLLFFLSTFFMSVLPVFFLYSARKCSIMLA